MKYLVYSSTVLSIIGLGVVCGQLVYEGYYRDENDISHYSDFVNRVGLESNITFVIFAVLTVFLIALSLRFYKNSRQFKEHAL